MRVGDLVRFKSHENEESWQIGLLLRYDSFTKVAEILKGSTFITPLDGLWRLTKEGKNKLLLVA